MLSFLWTADAHEHSGVVPRNWPVDENMNGQQIRNKTIFITAKCRQTAGGSVVTVPLWNNTLLCSAIIIYLCLSCTNKETWKNDISPVLRWNKRFVVMVIVAEMCAETRRRFVYFCCVFDCVFFFLTVNVWSYCLWHQLEVSLRKKEDYQSIISFHNWFMTIAKYCHCPVIFKAKAWPDLLTVCVYYCKIANILYFQLLCFVICIFFLINDLYGVC